MTQVIQVLNVQSTKEELAEAAASRVLEGLNPLLEKLKINDPEKLMTRQEAADFFSVDLSTIWAWTKKGRIRSWQISGRVYYKRSELEASLQPIKSLKDAS